MIDFGVQHFAGNRFVGTRRVIDISGDGATNHGRDLAAARDEAVAAGITINRLPMATDRLRKLGWPRPADVAWFYANHVIGGPGERKSKRLNSSHQGTTRMSSPTCTT